MIPERGPLRVLGAGTLVNTVGNGAFMAAGVLSFIRAVGLSPARVGLGIGFAKAVGPGLLALLCITWGRPGRVFLADLFLVAGGLQPVATRWAVRTRPLDGSPSVAWL